MWLDDQAAWCRNSCCRAYRIEIPLPAGYPFEAVANLRLGETATISDS